MRVLFVEPRPPRPHVFSRIQLPRVGPVLLATILNERGHEARVVVEEIRDITEADLEWADAVGISTLTPTAPRAYALADRVRAMGKPVFMGGPHVTFLPDEALDHVDVVVRGEGDETVPELVDAWAKGGAVEGIAGISFRRGGQTVHTPDRPLLKDLDDLPSPDFSLVTGWSTRRVTPISTSRGCPFRCRFCSVIPMFGTRYRFQSVGRVLADLERYAGTTEHVFFCDDNFAAHRGRARAICEGILARGLDLEWSAQVRTDVARDPDLVRLMARSGCWYVFIGLESINPKTLEAYDKRQTVQDIRRSVEVFHEHGIHVHGMFVLGADTDDRTTVRRTVEFARSLSIESVQFLILTPAPGTGLFEDMEKQGRLLTKDWTLYDGHHVVFEPVHFTPDELQREAVRATARFYSLRRVCVRIGRRNWFHAGLNLYAWHQARRFRRSVRPFVKALRRDLEKSLAPLRQALTRRRIRRVAYPVEGVPSEHLQYLRELLEALRLQLVEIATSPERVLSRISRVQGQADLVLVPLGTGGEAGPARFRPAEMLLRPWRLDPLPVVTLPQSPEAFQRACLDLAYVLGRTARAARRAHRVALASLGIGLSDAV